eukprot:GHVP01031792.1.p1 GENE.GHVP01031792.1~~GHVP01031792.1.p1  ORF type:complete len:120 (-),score=18.44 GHVP01031792.1:96-455(-)
MALQKKLPSPSCTCSFRNLVAEINEKISLLKQGELAKVSQKAEVTFYSGGWAGLDDFIFSSKNCQIPKRAAHTRTSLGPSHVAGKSVPRSSASFSSPVIQNGVSQYPMHGPRRDSRHFC